MDISQPHDSFFRYVISKKERAIDFVRYNLPSQIAQHLLVDTLTPLPDTFVDAQLKNRYSDALFGVQTRSGNPAYLYTLIDHKSSPDPDVPLQLLGYDHRIWERHLANQPGDQLPPIIGVVMYHGSRPWNIDTDFRARFDCADDLLPYQPLFRYVLIDLSTMEEEQILGRPDTRAAMNLFRYIFHPRLHEYLPALLKILKEGRHQPDFLSFFEAFLLYLLQYLNQEHHKQAEQLICDEFPAEGETIMPSVADKLREEGLKKGREEGRERLINGLFKLLQAKFQEVPFSLREDLHAVHDLAVLEAIMDHAISAQSLQQFQEQVRPILSRTR